MNFGKFDMMLLVSMALAVIGMSFVFPAMGLTSLDEAEAADVPEYNSSADDFDFAGEFPDSPGTPSQGDLEVNSDGGEERSLQSGDNDYSTAVIDDQSADPNNVTPRVFLHHYDPNNNHTEVNTTLQNEGGTAELENGEFVVSYEWVNTIDRDHDDRPVTAVVRYSVEQQPSDNVWYNRIPVVGAVFSAGEQLAGIVGWIGSIIYWMVAFFITILINVFFALFDTIVFTASLMHWLISTYMSVVTAASGFASVFVMVPGLLLFLEFLKLTFITVNLLWIG